MDQMVRRAHAVLAAAALAAFSTGCAATAPQPVRVGVPAASSTETVVLLRHGEKPPAGLGQLDCQGLNRALALPAVLNRKFGAPHYIFAPNPGQAKPDKGVSYNYIRPLATIEPTAIRDGLPVDARYGFDDVDGLRRELLLPKYQNATVFVAWEHVEAERLAKDLLKAGGGDPRLVPYWHGTDFDSLYVVRIRRHADGQLDTSFTVDREGLGRLPTACPGVSG